MYKAENTLNMGIDKDTEHFNWLLKVTQSALNCTLHRRRSLCSNTTPVILDNYEPDELHDFLHI